MYGDPGEQQSSATALLPVSPDLSGLQTLTDWMNDWVGMGEGGFMWYVAHKATLDAWHSLGPSGHLAAHGSRLAARTVVMTLAFWEYLEIAAQGGR